MIKTSLPFFLEKSYPIFSVSILLTLTSRAFQLVLILLISHIAGRAAEGDAELIDSIIAIVPLLVGIPLLDAAADHCIYRLQHAIQLHLQPAALDYDLRHPGSRLTEQAQSWVGQEGVSLVFYVLQQRLSGIVSLIVLCSWNIPLGFLVGLSVWYSGTVTARYTATMQKELEGTTDEPALRSHFYWQTLTSPTFAEELRLYGLGQTLATRLETTSAEKQDGAKSRSQRFWKLNLRASIPFIAAVLIYFGWNLFAADIDYAAFLSAVIIAFPGLAGLGSLGSIQVRAHEFDELIATVSARPALPSSPSLLPGSASTHTDTTAGDSVVDMRDVVFSYGDRPVLDHLNFRVEPGEKVAIVGENGAGKSTLIKLLIGELQPDSGSVFLAERNPNALTNSDCGVGLVAQDFMKPPFVTSDAIELGRDNLHPQQSAIITGLGIDTFGEQRDENTQYSRGQWQKLAIARALVTQPAPWGRLLILDEPASALDIGAEKALYSSVITHADPTDSLIIITHRLLSITNVDRIIVLKDAQISEQGTHQQLMDLGGHYAHMYAVQHASYTTDHDGTDVGGPQ
ncbi:ATP-binding cassette domain-containing protein [Corynebacterium aquilae]|uniref:ABC transporter domain-containing protein n=1 Tax=Corynebacterium aquilae DSM 44791 TaxID=1431546 RepID=A0A1L7CD25_9CORY|nr:ABC transporter ATP-binding protein [Corynebacterium aquilae]APT83752.1 hypothetical protein CAQU_00075 [Corynebacterium aquilae DSM 44791]